MTIEELKNKLISEAQVCWNKLNITKRVCGSEFSYYDGYVDCGFIKEEQIRALQKQNGELTDKVKELEQKLIEADNATDVFNAQEKRIEELEAQIEKMKCCGNCDFFNYRFEACYYDKECKNKDHWKLRR